LKTDFPIVLTENLIVLGNYYFNLYLVKGKNGSALIETGVSGTVDRVTEQLESLDVYPSYLIVTHPHADHITGLDGLVKKFPNAVVATGDGAEKFLSHPKAIEAMLYEDRFITEMLKANRMFPGRAPIETGIKLPENSVVLKQNDEIDLGGIIIRCIEVKGHSPAHISIHIPDINALIVSDSVGFHFPGRGFLPLFLTNYQSYLKSLNQIISMKPEIMGPGHQCPLTGKDAEKALKVSHETTLNLYSRIMNENKPPDEIADDIFNEYYKDEFRIYSESNIMNCCKLLVRRSMESA